VQAGFMGALKYLQWKDKDNQDILDLNLMFVIGDAPAHGYYTPTSDNFQKDCNGIGDFCDFKEEILKQNITVLELNVGRDIHLFK
jgi:hypothetical protein